MNTFKDYVEEKLVTRKPIKIIRKKWKTDYPGYKVEFNNLENHPLIPRIQDRTNLSLNDIKIKFDKAILYIIDKNSKNFFKEKSMVEILMSKSKFKILIMINPFDNYIRFSTVLGIDMKTSNVIRWKLNENEMELPLIELEISE